MNLKTWILKFLKQESISLENHNKEYKKILAIRNIKTRNDKLQALNRLKYYSISHFNANRGINFIQARIQLMPDIICGHMAEYAPGSIKSKKCEDNREILKLLDKKINAYINSGASYTFRRAELNDIIELAKSLEYDYCWVYDT